MLERVYITTALPYVNYPPHLGFALELLQADALARYYRSLGCEVLFLTGTDENGFKIPRAASAQGTDPASLSDRNSAAIQKLGKILDISFDAFYRTSSKLHFKGATHFWRSIRALDIYRDKWRGWYCNDCEKFFKQRLLIDENLCPEHLKPLEYFEEDVFQFNLQNYKLRIRNAITDKTFQIAPETRVGEVLDKLANYANFNISRKRESNWAVPVPGWPDDVIYPFFEALTSYINAVGYGSNNAMLEEWWKSQNTKIIQCIGRGITPFFTIYWPAMLFSVNLRLPDKLFIHGHMLVDGRKMSKSLRNVVDPGELVGRYGQDAVRYYLLGRVSPFNDFEYSASDLENAKCELENSLIPGIDALLTFNNSNCKNFTGNGLSSHVSPGLSKFCQDLLEIYNAQMEQCDLNNALKCVWPLIERAGSLIGTQTSLARETAADLTLLSVCGAHILLPFLPIIAQELLNSAIPAEDKVMGNGMPFLSIINKEFKR